METTVISPQQRKWTGLNNHPMVSSGQENSNEQDYSKMRIPGYHPFEEFAEALEAAVERKL